MLFDWKDIVVDIVGFFLIVYWAWTTFVNTSGSVM